MPVGQTGGFRVVNLVVRSERSAAELAPALRAALARVDPALPASEVRSMEDFVDATVFARRPVVLLVMGFAAFGLLLASLGLYAVIAYSVRQRRQEIGIRPWRVAARGADPRARGHARLIAVGMIVGLPLAWAAGRALRGLLFGAEPADPVTVSLVLGLLALVAVLAGCVPARRAARVDAGEILPSP